MPNRMSEDMSDRMPEDVPVRTCINVMVGITRSKVIYLFIFFRCSFAMSYYISTTRQPAWSPFLECRSSQFMKDCSMFFIAMSEWRICGFVAKCVYPKKDMFIGKVSKDEHDLDWTCTPCFDFNPLKPIFSFWPLFWHWYWLNPTESVAWITTRTA